MNEDVTFIMRRNYLDKNENLPQDIYLKVVAEICHYGCEKEPLFPDDALVQALVNAYKDGIDYSKDKYAQKIKGGRPQKISDEMILEGIREGKTAAEMAKDFGCDPTTIVKREVWKKRKEIVAESAEKVFQF